MFPHPTDDAGRGASGTAEWAAQTPRWFGNALAQELFRSFDLFGRQGEDRLGAVRGQVEGLPAGELGEIDSGFGGHAAYAKLRPRNSIDFPRLGVAVAFTLTGEKVSDLRIVVTALAATPQALRNVGEIAEGRAPDESLWEELGAAAFKQCHPLTNIDGDKTYRREMVPVYVKRALRDALENGASA